MASLAVEEELTASPVIIPKTQMGPRHGDRYFIPKEIKGDERLSYKENIRNLVDDLNKNAGKKTNLAHRLHIKLRQAEKDHTVPDKHRQFKNSSWLTGETPYFRFLQSSDNETIHGTPIVGDSEDIPEKVEAKISMSGFPTGFKSTGHTKDAWQLYNGGRKTRKRKRKRKTRKHRKKKKTRKRKPKKRLRHTRRH